MAGVLYSIIMVMFILVDSHLLNGTWKIVKVEGGDLPKEELLVTFQNGTVKLQKDAPFFKPFRINPHANPKWIDIQLEDNTYFPGIYHLEGDFLKIYLITESDGNCIPPRPKNFKDKHRGQLLHLERVKK